VIWYDFNDNDVRVDETEFLISWNSLNA
jgi:hypothetical protein